MSSSIARALLRLDEVDAPRMPRGRDGQLRKIALAGEPVDYRLIRARRRTIGMAVDLTGLTVRAPRWVTLAEIEAALVERAQWIVKALAEWRGRRREVMPRQWKSGAPILYRGRELALEVFPSRRVRIDPDLFNLTVLHPRAEDEAEVALSVVRCVAAIGPESGVDRTCRKNCEYGAHDPKPTRLDLTSA